MKNCIIFIIHFKLLIVGTGTLLSRHIEVVLTSSLNLHKFEQKYVKYCNDPKFLDKQVWANSADPDQTAPV